MFFSQGAIKGEKWNFDKVYNFTVEASFNDYNDEKDFTLQLKASESFGHKFWRNYQPDNIKVNVTLYFFSLIYDIFINRITVE